MPQRRVVNKVRVRCPILGGSFPVPDRGCIREERDLFLCLVLAPLQNLLSGFEVLFARQGSLFGFALSDASDPIRCNFNRADPHNLHGTVQQHLHGKRKLRFGRKQPVVRCQRDECIDDQHQGFRFSLPACISDAFPCGQNEKCIDPDQCPDDWPRSDNRRRRLRVYDEPSRNNRGPVRLSAA